MRRLVTAIVLGVLVGLPSPRAEAADGPPAGFVLTAGYQHSNVAGPALNGQETPPNADLGPPLVFHDRRIESIRPWDLTIRITDESGGDVFAIADIGPTTEVSFCTATKRPILVPPGTDEIEVSLYDGTCEGGALSLTTTGSATLRFVPHTG